MTINLSFIIDVSAKVISGKYGPERAGWGGGLMCQEALYQKGGNLSPTSINNHCFVI